MTPRPVIDDNGNTAALVVPDSRGGVLLNTPQREHVLLLNRAETLRLIEALRLALERRK